MSKAFKIAIKVAQLCAKGTPPSPRETIHLCNWYIALVRPGSEIPDNQFQCIVPMKMTKFDIRNYFEKIYDIRVKQVNTRIQQGKVKHRHPGLSRETYKRPDYKVAYVTMVDQTFKFPSIFETFEEERKLPEKEKGKGSEARQ